MNPFRKNVAIAIDGGGIRGVVITRALSHLEDHLGKPVRQIFQLTAGTSTGSIISAAISAGLTAKQMHKLESLQNSERAGKLSPTAVIDGRSWLSGNLYAAHL